MSWIVCQNCLGRGKKSRKLSNKARTEYSNAYARYENSNYTLDKPVRPKGSLLTCANCDGTGIIESINVQSICDNKFPHIAIVGAGIAGVALAVACKHRGIPFTIFERDESFDIRSQGYGLTLQQANRALKSLGIKDLKEGVVSTRHVAHSIDGIVIGEWGTRKWCSGNINRVPKRSNVHIARQALRKELINQLGSDNTIKWGHQLIGLSINHDKSVQLNFSVGDKQEAFAADLVVGADGIRSAVRRLLFGDSIKPLRYLNCIVILGICHLSDLKDLEFALLDQLTVFQTVNGNERIYVMPYSKESVMWQLSFPMDEIEAKRLSTSGAEFLKLEAIKRVDWHQPIPQIIQATQSNLISGYPVYDRELLTNELDVSGEAITLIGDAAHPMSPFKGQGANQAILDALALARAIYNEYHYTSWTKSSIREDILTDFESEMMSRSSVKVQDSADAAVFLHSDFVFEGGDQPRGRNYKR